MEKSQQQQPPVLEEFESFWHEDLSSVSKKIPKSVKILLIVIGIISVIAGGFYFFK